MHTAPLISIVVPVYKVEEYLDRCLNSICKQTYRHLEIICVDDGSPDRSIDILRDYAARDGRIKIIRQANGGLSAARNSGLAVAKGEWITFVDSDDWIEESAYEECVTHLSDEIDLVVFGVQIEWDSDEDSPERRKISRGMKEFHRIKLEGEKKFTSAVMLATDPCAWNKLYRASVIKKNHLTFPVSRWYEDASFTLRFILAGRCGYYMKNFSPYHYVQRAGSIMGHTRRHTSRAIDFLEIIRDVYSVVCKRKTTKEDRSFLARLSNDFIRSALVNTTEDKLTEVHVTARQILTEMRISHMGEYDYIYRVSPSIRGFLRRFFHSWKGKKEKFGIWGFKPLAIHHLGDVDAWRLFDIQLFTIRRD